MYEMEQIEETVILAGIDTGDGEAAERSLMNWKNWQKLPAQRWQEG